MKDGKVYTPDDIVQFMVNGLSFKDTDKVLEPSCGDGAFLGYLPKTVVANDTDSVALQSAKEKYPWVSFKNLDFLGWDETDKYDYIIGNPPYIKYQDLPEETRNQLSFFETCQSGNVDLYYAFIEKAIRLLKENGLLKFIIPNKWLVNTFASSLRKFLVSFDVEVFDYKDEKVFENADTYSCILTVKKSNKNKTITIKSKSGQFDMRKSELTLGEPWVNTSLVGKKYGCINMKYGISTLADKVFIFLETKDGKYFSRVKNDWVELEERLIRPIIKASTLEMQWCLFPYDDKADSINLDDYPKSKAYLESIKDFLLDRDFDGNWYEFGRSQGLKSQRAKKIVISSLVSPTEGFRYRLVEDPDVLVYSGLYQTEKFDELEELLHDQNVINYVLENGSKRSGGYSVFSPKLLKPFKAPIGFNFK